MISYLQGKIIHQGESFVVVEVNGIGYEVWLSAESMAKMAKKDESENEGREAREIKLPCFLDVGERSLRLFGFLTWEELEVFKIVRAIQGVGPRASLEISAVGSLEKLNEEIKAGGKFLNHISGIGPKRASKIVLELSGKISLAKTAAANKNKKDDGEWEANEAYLALEKLGFPKDRIKQALIELPQDLPIQEKIRQALKFLGK